MELKKLIAGIEKIETIGQIDLLVESIVSDSRKATLGSVFVAIQGTQVDAHNFIPQVIEQGCAIVVVNRKLDLPDAITQIVVENTAKVLGQLAHTFYGEPSKELTLIGITGTNGKTTTTTLLHKLFTQLGYHVGLISTVVNKIGNQTIPSTHTTPDPIALNVLLAQMVAEGCSHCFMEVSSHAVDQHRIAGLEFKIAGFTNITHDHLDYHGTFKAYLNAKKAFFDGLNKEAIALINYDDKNGPIMVQNTKAKIRSYAMKTLADYHVKVLENGFTGLVLTLNGTEVWTRLIGDFNAYNLTLVYGVALELNQDKNEVLQQLSTLTSVDGRFQFVQGKTGVIAIVDYAHTPDALQNVLKTIENIRTRNESVITVVGCGGNRDALKRPEMAKIACNLSDKVIFTSDNPRNEDPSLIIKEMEGGVEPQHFMKTLSILDRDQAIKTAVSMAQPNDILLIAGKGHEKYQEISGVKYPFDDLESVTNYISKFNK